ncbi:MAG: hypothetical protein IKM99_08820 [Bacteroidales bacterium]|nr:hypothetical protein [Bacteroidales bacterium]
MKRNVILMAALLLTSVAMTSCFKDKPDTSQEGLYVGIIGFNDELHTKTLKILNDQTKDEMKEYIDNLSMSNGTILYHAVNTALDKIESITPPADLINVSVITFTDGLDQGSYVLNDNYNSNDDYLNAVSNRIKSTYISDIPVSAYTIGVKGSDVVDINSFRRNLEKLSSNEENVYEVESMSQVGTIFADIAQDLYNQSSSYDVTLKLPAQNPGTLIRFTFDNVEDATQSTMYIEGTYSRQNNKGLLNEVTYVGLQDCGPVIYATSSGIFDEFTFVNLLTPDGEQVPATLTKQWNYIPSSNAWQNNSEFTPSGNTVVKEEFKSALVMLVLDCSSSLSNDFQSVKNAARQFIETLNGNTHQGN